MIFHTVSSDDAGPAHEIVVHADSIDRVTAEFHTSTRWWDGQKLVFHGGTGLDRFRPHYYLLTPDGWSPITAEITSERGFVYGRVHSVEDVTIRLVVAVRTMHRYGEVYRHRFSVVAGGRDGKEKTATVIVEARA